MRVVKIANSNLSIFFGHGYVKYNPPVDRCLSPAMLRPLPSTTPPPYTFSIRIGWGEHVRTTCTNAEPAHFAQLDSDSESTTSHAQYRQYSPLTGRWMRPDPYSGSYDFNNPQSLNRYFYLPTSPSSPPFINPQWAHS